MDDTVQSPSQQPVQQPVLPQQVVHEPSPNVGEIVQMQPLQQPQQDADESLTHVSVPIGGKESIGAVVAEVQPTHPEIVVPQEVQEAGVEAAPSEEPQLTQEHKDAGVEVVKEATPLPSGPTTVQLPDTYKAPKGFFDFMQQHVKDAATWFYLLLFKVEEQKSIQQAQEKNDTQ